MKTNLHPLPQPEAALSETLSEYSDAPIIITLAKDASQLVRWASRFFGRSPQEIASGVLVDMLGDTFEDRKNDDLGHIAAYHVHFAQRAAAIAPDDLAPAPQKESGPPAKDALLNCAHLAKALGHSAGYVSAMKAAGYTMEFGGTRTTLRHAMKWLRDNPGFRATGYNRATPEKRARMKRAA